MAFVENTVAFTILFPALSFAVSFISRFFINRRFFAYMVVAVAALAITAVVQMVKTAVNDAWSAIMIPTALFQVIWSIPLAAAAYLGPAKWIKE